MAEIPQRRNLAPAIRSSLNAKLERLLSRPIIASIKDSSDVENHNANDDSPDVFRAILNAARDYQPVQTSAWCEDPDDGTCSVRIHIDYDDLWRGDEKEILETVASTVEGEVTFLTDVQKQLLEKSPRKFLDLDPRPESAELVSFKTENVGGSKRVVELKVASPPTSPGHIHYIAIVPNLVQIERQLDALYEIECATDDGPIAPLRALVGLSDACCPAAISADAATAPLNTSLATEQLDEHQAECIHKAIATPHFAVIQGPPGSGKTTVITSIIRRVVGDGKRVLVVSPTHVAVDNVVEKLVPNSDALQEDRLELHTLPLRYAAKKNKLSDIALEYWVGSKKQIRGATISRRIQRCLTETIPFAEALYAKEDQNAHGLAPLSSAVVQVESVICGTPIGILSYNPVKSAAPGEFDLLIVDEVSKMTLPEFLAIAVKARRWVLVGDPEQLPPYNNAEENATTLDDVIDPFMELVCSVGGVLERAKPGRRGDERLAVVTSDPTRVASAIREHIETVHLNNSPSVAVSGNAGDDGIIVCSSDELDDACVELSPARGRDHSHNPGKSCTVRILVERGITRPELTDGMELVEPRKRAQALIFENSFNVYHAQPWGERSDQKLPLIGFRNGLEKYLPSSAAIQALNGNSETDTLPDMRRSEFIDVIAERFAINTISVYDWLTGIPTNHFDKSPLLELGLLSPVSLCEAVQPFVGTLKKQYRMHASLSRVPRELFYFGKALHDGISDNQSGCRVVFRQVEADYNGESNACEVDAICDMLVKLNDNEAARLKELNDHEIAEWKRPKIMIITPYREQEALLREAIDELRECSKVDNLNVEACTLDRCQGREAEYVFISLVRSYATKFFDMPKRWNVALTRAKQGLIIVGNINAYLREAKNARYKLRDQSARRNGRGLDTTGSVRMSLLARIIESYGRQINGARSTGKPRRDM